VWLDAGDLIDTNDTNQRENDISAMQMRVRIINRAKREASMGVALIDYAIMAFIHVSAALIIIGLFSGARERKTTGALSKLIFGSPGSHLTTAIAAAPARDPPTRPASLDC
jgi:hypothetical protein